MNTGIINEEKIIEAEKQLLEAMIKSDVEILDQLIHSDLLFVLPNGDVISKEMDLETHKSGAIIFKEIVSSIETIKLIDENAIVTVLSKVKGKMRQQIFEGQFKY